MPLERLDSLSGRIQQLVSEIGKGTRRSEVLAHDRHARILGRPLGLAEAMEPLARKLENRIRPRPVRVFCERDLDAPTLLWL